MQLLRQCLSLIALLTLSFAPSPEVVAHTGEKPDPVRLTIARWAVAYQGDDYATMGELLAADFGDTPAARNHYLARMRALPFKQVILRYANYRIDGEFDYQARVDGIKAGRTFLSTSPIYVETDGKPRRSAASAAYLAQICKKTIGWASSVARYHDETQRREVVDLYKRGCNVFARQSGQE